MITGAIFALFLLCITIQLVYVLQFFSAIFRINAATETIADTTQPVSVIICAKNEAENLQRNLPVILAQRYSNASGINNYEVVVVNDASTDHTAQVLEGFAARYPHLKLVHISPDVPRTLPGKKFALSKAVALAQHDVLLMTDADCVPASDTWLQQMVVPLQNGKVLVGGYGKYAEGKGGLNAFIRWETLHTFVQYAGYALSGMPYMAVGRNLACTKAALLAAQQTDVWGKLPSGDDDLLVKSAGEGHNMGIVASATAATISAPSQSWQDWFNRKQRHISTGKYYRTGTKLALGIYALSHALVWLLFIAALFTTEWQTALGVMAVRCAIYWWLWQHVCNKTGEKGLVKWFPLMDMGWMLYNFVLSPYIFWKNKQQWI